MVKNNSFKTLLLKIIASLVLLMPVGLCTFLIQELYYYFTSIFYVTRIQVNNATASNKRNATSRV